MHRYTDQTRQMWGCQATKRNGERCRQSATWTDPLQHCVQHAGLGHHGPQQRREPWSISQRPRRTAASPPVLVVQAGGGARATCFKETV
jgi:hypothetical protein